MCKNMRAVLFYILLTFLGLRSYAQAADEARADTTAYDTVYIYSNWKSIMANDPAAAYSGPIVYYNNELETEVFTSDAESQLVVDNQAIAANIGDTLWLANTNYINKVFNNKREWFLNYIPLYFTEKIAFVKFWNGYPSEYYMRLMPNKKVETIFTYDCQSSFFILDFIDRQLVELNYKVLTSLLARYPDLQMRYLAMKRYKAQDVVDFYFMQYIDRLKNDDDALTIIEQLNQHNK